MVSRSTTREKEREATTSPAAIMISNGMKRKRSNIAKDYAPCSRRQTMRRLKRIQQRYRTQRLPAFASVLSFLLLNCAAAGYSRDISICQDVINWSDIEGNGVITRSEYKTVIAGMSYGEFTSDFNHLPLALQEPFTKWAHTPCSDHDSSVSKYSARCIDLAPLGTMKGFCHDIELAIDNAPPQPTRIPNALTGKRPIAPTSYPSPSINVPVSDFEMQYSPGVVVEFNLERQDNEDKTVWRSSERILQTQQNCKIYMSIGDSDRNNKLEKQEYATFLNRLSNNQFEGLKFDELPVRFKDHFSDLVEDGGIDISGSKPGQSPNAEQTENLEKLCNESIELLAQTQAPVEQPSGEPPTNCEGTIAKQRCYIDMSISDSNRDSLLVEEEYLRFVNRLSNYEYQGEEFENLPGNIKDNFFNLALNGSIVLTGSKPGQSATQQQQVFLARVCCETDLATQNPSQPTTPPPDSEPTEPPGPSCDETITRKKCNIYLSIADLNRDSILKKDEYVRFLNRLSDNSYSGLEFEFLPRNLIENYKKFSNDDDDGIDIFGAKPGQQASIAQDEQINDMCCQTDLLVNGITPPTEPDGPALSPTSSPTISNTQCRNTLRETDFNRDNYLNQNEYARFVNRLSNGILESLVFNDLPCPLPETYETLAGDNGQIYIFGAALGQIASESQSQFMLAVCSETIDAINNPSPVWCPVSEPTTFPDSQAPTATPVDGPISVYNSFIIANTNGINAKELESGPNRVGLESAYKYFIVDAVTKVAQDRTSSPSLLRRRRLEVSLEMDSPDVYNIIDSDCPEVSDIQTCQTAFATFIIQVVNENPTQVSEKYTKGTQKDIELGIFQAVLKSNDPGSALKIVNASYPVIMPSQPTVPTIPPTSSPGIRPVPEGSSSNAGGTAGAVIGVLLFLVFGGWYSRKKGEEGEKTKIKTSGDDEEDSLRVEDENEGDDAINGPLIVSDDGFFSFRKLRSLFRFSGGKVTGEESDDEFRSSGENPNTEEGDNEGDSDSKDKDENAFGAFHLDTDNTFGDNASSSLSEKPEKIKRKTFGFGKKKKEEDESNDFGLESVYSKDGAKQTSDFENYAFDDPSSAAPSSAAPSSAAEKKGKKEGDMFGNNVSPGWGATGSDYGIGTTWGAGGSSDVQEGSFFVNEKFVNSEDNFNGDDDDSYEGSSSSEESSSEESSEDSTYESDIDGLGHRFEEDSYSRSSQGEVDTSSEESSVAEIDMIEKSSWDRRAETVREKSMVDNSFDMDMKEPSEGEEDKESFSGSSHSDDRTSDEDESGITGSTVTSTSEERKTRGEYKAQVEALVRLVLPEEMEKVDAMMDQFKGREGELVSTLQTMQERSATQRARAAVHKSKSRPFRQDTRAAGSYAGANSSVVGASEGAAAGTAAIAAASLPIPAGGFDAPRQQASGGTNENLPVDDNMTFGSQGAFPEDGQDGDRFYSDKNEDSFYSDDKDGGFYDDDAEGSSFEERSQSHNDGDGQEDQGSQEESYYSESGEEVSYYSDEDSYEDEDEDSFEEEIVDASEVDFDGGDEFNDGDENMVTQHEQSAVSAQSAIWHE